MSSLHLTPLQQKATLPVLCSLEPKRVRQISELVMSQLPSAARLSASENERLLAGVASPGAVVELLSDLWAQAARDALAPTALAHQLGEWGVPSALCTMLEELWSARGRVLCTRLRGASSAGAQVSESGWSLEVDAASAAQAELRQLKGVLDLRCSSGAVSLELDEESLGDLFSTLEDVQRSLDGLMTK